MQTTTFHGIENCLAISNGDYELIATTAVGPRLLSYRRSDGENILAELPEVTLKTAMGNWKPYGGHRIWAAPERMPETYYPDNEPVTVEAIDSYSVLLRAPQERVTGLVKEMRVSLDRHSSLVTLDHLIANRSKDAVELAAWSLTIMRGGGTTILPQEPYRSHDDYLLAARPMVLWYFTDLTDPRWRIGKELVQLATDEAREAPQKIGILNKQCWAAYYRDRTLLVKEFDYDRNATYPDYGANNEAYTAGSFMELETLGPLVTLEPGETTEHRECWKLFSDVDLPEDEARRAQAIRELIG